MASDEPIKLVVQATDVKVIRSNIATTQVSGEEAETELMVTMVAEARFNQSDVTAQVEFFLPVAPARFIAQRLIEAAYVAEREWHRQTGTPWVPKL